MSKTIVDMPKVTQMLDAGWRIMLRKGDFGYVARGEHPNIQIWRRARDRVLAQTIEANRGEHGLAPETLRELNDNDFEDEGVIYTDDFTPEQALTRLAYKVHGEILDSNPA